MLLGVADPAGVSGGAGAVRPPPRPGADHPGRGRGHHHHHTLPSIPAGGASHTLHHLTLISMGNYDGAST